MRNIVTKKERQQKKKKNGEERQKVEKSIYQSPPGIELTK